MRIRIKIQSWLWSLAFALILFSCENKMEDYYERPSSLKGNAIELLESRGNYSMFLEAIAKSDFEAIVSGRGLITIMAPDDDAFTAYLNSKGYSSVNDLPESELNVLIGYHLVEYEYNEQLFNNFQPSGRINFNPEQEGFFYKHRTKASYPITQMQGLEQDGTPRTFSIYHRRLYLPVLSNTLFNTKEIDATYNYEYLYPNSTWTSDSDGFNVSEASVEEYEIPIENGFVYLIDRVLEPKETVHKTLEKDGNYSNFLTLYDRFSQFMYDEEATKNYGNGDSLFAHIHTEIPDLDYEWPYSGISTLNWSSLTSNAFSVFVPDGASLEAFYQDTWAPYYSSLSEVNLLPVVFLLYNHVYGGSMVFPEEIKKGEIFTNFGTQVSFDPDVDVTKSEVCNNGVYYALNSVQVPSMFNSITGPAYRDPKYRMFLHMIAYSGLYLPLSSDAINYTIFMPSDSSIIKSGYYDLPIEYRDPVKTVFGDEYLQITDGSPREMSTGEMTKFVDSHVATDLLTTVNGVKVYKSRNIYSYIFVLGNTAASNRIYNEDEAFVDIATIDGDWTNGTCYDVDSVILSEGNEFKYVVSSSDEVPYLKQFEEFSNLLTSAGLLPINKELDFILDRYMVFAPSNSAILNAPEGTFPSDPDSLANFLKYYFVPIPDNAISDYAFPGAGVEGEFITYQGFNDNDTIPPTTITLTDIGSGLSLATPEGQTANITTNIPKVYGDCAVYSIDAIIQPADSKE